MNSFLSALAGGILIGCSASILLIMNGRVAGISGIVAGVIGRSRAETLWRAAFVLGLLLGPALYKTINGRWPEVSMDASLPALVIGGLLVGFGTRMGSGCTSGHGVCGLGRLSRRSFVAVLVFMFAAIVTVLLRKGGFY